MYLILLNVIKPKLNFSINHQPYPSLKNEFLLNANWEKIRNFYYFFNMKIEKKNPYENQTDTATINEVLIFYHQN